jgi:hypothetical protein
MALKIAIFGFTRLAYEAEFNFTTCDPCLRNLNAIALFPARPHPALQTPHHMAR